MMIKYFGLLLIFVNGPVLGNNKVFYNKNGEITIPELATHYRLGLVDQETRSFSGHITEFDMNERLFLELHYDAQGAKNGYFKYDRFGLLLEGEFENNIPNISIPDSIVEMISKKERFVQSMYIRKRDYPGIRSILSPEAEYSDSVAVGGEVFRTVEELPTFPGGMSAVGQFLVNHLTYPTPAREKGVTGKVFVEFTIMADGTIDNIKTIKGLGYGCDESAEFAIRMLPDWKPGYQRGKRVPVRMVLPIRFQ